MIVKWMKLSKETRERETKQAMVGGGKGVKMWREKKTEKMGPDNMDEGRPQGSGRKKRKGMWTNPAAGCVHNNERWTRSLAPFLGHKTLPTCHVIK